MGGRIIDLAVVRQDPSTIYVATASGGLFKTTNNGTTFSPLFQDQATISIGDVCIAPSDPNVIWLGTGEHNGRNSSSWGDGVYKSTDAGKTWTNMGLKESYQIGRMAIHPDNPDIVYVGALGRLWGENEQRGIFKTTDGGTSWEKVLYIDARTGCVDLAMHPGEPDTLLAAMYERQRGGFDVGDPEKRWGPGSGIYKTTNGGTSWKKIKKGIPSRPLGRIGIQYHQADPSIVFATIESDMIGTGRATALMGITGGQRVPNAKIQGITRDGPAEKAGIQANDVVTAVDDTEITTYNSLVVEIRSHKPGDKVSVTLLRDDEEITVELTFGKRGGDSNKPFSSYLGGQRANAQDQQGARADQTGGVYRSSDGGASWERINSLNPRPFYYSQIHVDPVDPNHVFVLGIQLHYSSDAGKTFNNLGRQVHSDHHALWIDPRDGRHLVLGCDGGLYISYDRGKNWDFHNIMAIGQFYDVGVDNRPLYRVYGGLQDNGSWGGPNRTRSSSGPLNSDWIRIGGGDGFICRVDPENPDLVYYEAQYGRMARVNIQTGARARIRPTAPEGTSYRFNWKTPFLLSPHNSRIFFCAGNHVFRSLNRGDKLEQISPEITRTDRGSATALAQSPRDANLLYVGTDDGYLWVTRDGGSSWVNITANLALDGHYHVSTIEPSRFATGRAYLALDGHRSDSDAPHVFLTEDFGETWKSLAEGLPAGSSRTLREDPENENLLLLGTEFSIWASLDRGAHWSRINNNLPTVAIHEIAFVAGRGEIVAATHGRSLWTLDMSPLRQMTGTVTAAEAHLFRPSATVRWAGELGFSRYGQQHFSGQNPAAGCPIYFHLAEGTMLSGIEIRNVKGEVIRKLRTRPVTGLNLASWDLRLARQPAEGSRQAPRVGPPVAPGTYLVVLKVGERELSQEVTVLADPELPEGLLSEELEQFERKVRPRYTE
jgi:photosystem II stability/assembly factor-like uncharacterized protein